ncbi:3-carboxyethylcatechol 2,3-dioxygenase [Nocardia vaccinii]|uniref:3-carboxyethylcatechol 2,3-dioxygenase n=1 Tax=Nocardia vaccinii TaxID=1822 RepID=UPI000831F927|nr:3-carboxyethylcatechol 2,3-dioxygenase [Nocardia vaccinii]
MPLALCCVSHSPLLDLPGPDRELLDDIGAALDRAAEFVREFDPELVVAFSPDHYNGFFYKLMPPFCIGAAASGVGDYGTHSGPLDVPADLARELAESVLDAGVDVAMSMTMEVDHGTVQPLQRLLGSATARPVIPIFVNSVAVPLGPLRRAVALGAAVGDYLAGLGKRVLVVGSGGLSHDPPMPALATATGPARDRILHGGTMSGQQRAARQEQVIAVAREFASGSGQLRALNPDWDRRVLAALDDGRLDEFDDWSNPWITEAAGNSAHEVRTWVAAFGALASAGRYRTIERYYRPAPALIAGFAVRTALPQRDLDSTSRRHP